MLWKSLYFALTGGLLCLLCVVVLVPLVILLFRKHIRRLKERQNKEDPSRISVAFFHPYCNAGGGGERVLWCAVSAIQKRFPHYKIVVYTGDLNASPNEILNKVLQTFEIVISKDIEFVYLHKRSLLEAKYYPYFTLLGQSVGSVFVGIEALCLFVPDIYVDSTGCAFTLPLFSFVGGCRTACYIHYPTISKEMLKRVSSRQVAYNNSRTVARSPFLSFAKLVYYRFFAWLYSCCGGFCNMIMVNGSWTEEQINNVWECCKKEESCTYRVYPPCDTRTLKAMPLAKDISEGGPIKIISLSQFRPEKDHPLQLKSLYELRQLVPEETWDRIKLVFIGSCRNAEDETRAQDMKDFAKHLSLENNVEFKINSSFEELKAELASSMIGMHAMYNEHFGIAVVECMAAGHIMVANRSGGPQADLIEQSEGSRNGFLATDEVEYAEAIATILKLSPSARLKIREAARSSVDRFSTEEFEKSFIRTIEPLLSDCSRSSK